MRKTYKMDSLRAANSTGKNFGEKASAGIQKYTLLVLLMSIYTAAIFYGGTQLQGEKMADVVRIPVAQASK